MEQRRKIHGRAIDVCGKIFEFSLSKKAKGEFSKVCTFKGTVNVLFDDKQ